MRKFVDLEKIIFKMFWIINTKWNYKFFRYWLMNLRFLPILSKSTPSSLISHLCISHILNIGSESSLTVKCLPFHGESHCCHLEIFTETHNKIFRANILSTLSLSCGGFSKNLCKIATIYAFPLIFYLFIGN